MLALTAALQVFSTACLIWTLIDLSVKFSCLERSLAWLGTGLAILLSILPLAPGWPVPFQFHSLVIALGGAVLLAFNRRTLLWLSLGVALIAAVANFLGLLGFTNTSWFILLLGYGLLIVILHREGLEIQRRQQVASASVSQEALSQSQERQRLVEVSEIISAVPSLEQSLDHVARSLAHITHTDQAAILVMAMGDTLQAYLAALHPSPGQSQLADRSGKMLSLSACLPLQVAMTEQQQLLLPSLENSELNNLYQLWGEDRTGPTLIQPLVVQGRSIGALLLGNPVTEQTIRETDQRLCRSLASQVAMMVEAHRYYFHLKSQTEAVATLKAQHSAQADMIIAPEIVAEPELSLEQVAEFQSVSALSVALPVITKPQSLAAETRSTGIATVALPQALAAVEAPSPSRLASTTMILPEINSGDELLTSEIAGAPEYYLSILENVEEGVVVSDARGRVKLVNKAAEHLLGKPRRELLNQSIGTIYGKIDSTEAIEELATAFSRRNEPLPTFFENENRAIQGRLTPWRNQEGEWLGIIAVFRDVTPQVKADRARHNFVTALSRVLRGPLTLIKGYAELITNGSIENYSAEQLQVQRIIHSSAEQVVEVLDNAIQISTQNKGKRLPRFETVNITRVILEALQQITPLAQLRHLELIRDISPDLPSIVVDPKHLYRILENLLSNACRFTPPGGQVRLQAWIQNEREGSITRPYLLLTVADNGVGIPKIEQRRIFEPFYQLNNQRPDTESGMGMGLAVVKELVELHNGRVWVESSPGEGSAFHVLLPVSQG
jgi:PAS domain S-box-containing protein